MTRPNRNTHVSIDSIHRCGQHLLFELQPIVNAVNTEVLGFEFLFRGQHPDCWLDVDAALLSYLARPRNLPRVFVNLSNQGLMEHTVGQFMTASRANNVIFEISESVNEYAQRDLIAEKVNALIASGVSVALDDFGAGRDSLERLYSLDQPTAVKIDRAFLLTCMRREDAGSTLRHMIEQWRANGILSIAEGVETAAVLEFARSVGADLVQGWHIDGLMAQAEPVQRYAR